jgi:hypothetical protein
VLGHKLRSRPYELLSSRVGVETDLIQVLTSIFDLNVSHSPNGQIDKILNVATKRKVMICREHRLLCWAA